MTAYQSSGGKVQISIVLPSCGREESCARTVAALGQIDVPAGTAGELILVRNGPLDPAGPTVADACLPNGIALRVQHQPQPGKSRALNTGLAIARGAVLVFTDDDIIPPADWLEKLAGPILRGEADGVVGDVRLPPHLNPPWLPSTHRAWLADMSGVPVGNAGRMVGANMACSRSALATVEGFDLELGPGGRFGFGEDTLLSEQLCDAGFRIVDVLDATVEHHFPPQRLERQSWLDAARKFGRTDAYLSHHWLHARWSRPHWTLAKAALRLAVCRLRSPGGKPAAADPALPPLLDATRHFAACLQYLQERRRPVRHRRRSRAGQSGANGGVASGVCAPPPQSRVAS